MWRIVRPDSADVWNNELVRSRLSRYFGIINGILLPKFRVARSVPIDLSLDSGERALWDEHARVSRIFRKTLTEIDKSKRRFDEIRVSSGKSYLDLKIELAERIVRKCHLCERRCNVDRLKNERGFCKLGIDSFVSTFFLHMGEESVLVPSGTIFFAGCNFGPCVFCQNYDISGDSSNGQVTTPLQLAKISAELKRQGALNLNWVGGSPTPNLHNIIASMKYLDSNICQLWNSNFYMSRESTELLLDVVDFWLPDLKWFDDECALRYSRVPNYWNIVSRNHKAVHDRGGGEIIVRHLVMPGHVNCCTKPILNWISKTIPKALVNLMAQYHPAYLVNGRNEYAQINRRPSQDEMKEAYNCADELNLLWRPVS